MKPERQLGNQTIFKPRWGTRTDTQIQLLDSPGYLHVLPSYPPFFSQ